MNQCIPVLVMCNKDNNLEESGIELGISCKLLKLFQDGSWTEVDDGCGVKSVSQWLSPKPNIAGVQARQRPTIDQVVRV